MASNNKVCVNIDQTDPEHGGFTDAEKQQARNNIGACGNDNIAPEYNPKATYPIIGTPCMHEGVLYRSKVAINTAENWTEAHWVRSLALQYDDALSSTSENAVKNKVLYAAISEQVVLSATPYDSSIELTILNAVKRAGFLLFNGTITKLNGGFSVNAANNLFYIGGITLAMDFRNYYGSAQLSSSPGLFPCAMAGLKNTNLFYIYPTAPCDVFYFNASIPIN